LELEIVALVLMTVFGLAIAAAMIWVLIRGKRKV
jgi:uncharacterized membrane protein SpoIIM required for sporulation